MEKYEALFLQQLAPFLVVDNRYLSPASTDLIDKLASFNIANAVWDNSIINSRMLNTKYIIKVLQGESEGDEMLRTAASHRLKRDAEHNRLSPFNLDSDLFPNGVLSKKWFKKYIEDLPFAVITIYHLPEDPKDDDLFLKTLNKHKTSYTDLHIKFTAIIVSDNTDTSADDSRIVRFRQSTGLPQLTGIVYLNTDKAAVKRDTEVLVNALLPSLRPFAVEFYSNIEYKIRQRYKKYYTCPPTNRIVTVVELTPKFLELRNLIKQSVINQFAHPHNIDSTLKTLESAYGAAVGVLGESLSSLTESKELYAHDSKLYTQFRTLTDIIAFHLVRGYLSIEDPVAALKKHQTHIDNVLHVTSSFGIEDTAVWAATQYQWLAELLELVPKSILKGLQIKYQKKRGKNSKSVEFVGGLQILDSYDFNLITHPGLFYLKSASISGKPSKKASQFKYLSDEATNNSARIELLEKGLLLLEVTPDSHSNTDDEGNNIAPYVIYAKWCLAEEHFNLKEPMFSKALQYYGELLSYARGQPSLPKGSHQSWGPLVSLLLHRVFSCYQGMEDLNNSALSLLNMATVETSDLATGHIESVHLFDQLKDDTIIQVELKQSENLYDLNALLVNENMQKPESVVYDNIITQLVFTPKLRTGILKRLLGDPDISIVLRIDDVVITYSDNFGNVHLKHDEKHPSKVFNEVKTTKLEHQLSGTVNFSSPSGPNEHFLKIVNIDQVVEKAGPLLIESVKIKLIVEVSKGSKRIEISLQETTAFPGDTLPQSPVSHTSIYKRSSLGHFRTPIRLHRNSTHSIQVLPLRPDVSVTMTKEMVDCIIVGEKLLIPFEIKYKHPEKHRLKFDKLLLTPSATIVYNEPDSAYDSSIKARINWDGLKDDEGLNLESLAGEDGGKRLHVLNIAVNKPNYVSEDSTAPYRVFVDLKTMVKEHHENTNNEQDEELDTYDTAAYNLPVIDQAFETIFIISPRYRSDSVAGVPNPFIIGNQDQISDKSMPISTRLWKASVLVVDKLKVYETDNSSSELEIVLYEFSVKTKNPELVIDLIDASNRDESGISQLFTTRSKHGLSHRNVNVLTSVTIHWRRKGSTTDNTHTNVFQSDDAEIVLPLSDPRVLLSAAKDKNTEHSVEVKYIIENPTPRIFTFNTQLETDDQWDFNDARNISPFKHLLLPVLPFSKHVMEYYGKIEEHDNGSYKLPQFKVYDVNFKVGLPTLSACDEITLREKAFFWKRS